MRVTLVSETYFPQVNGVSRTLGQLVRVLRASGDIVQLIHPRYGETPERDHDYFVRSVRMPFYPELRLPIPPFRGVRGAIDAFQPDILHIATEATLGMAALRHARSRKIPTVSSFHTHFGRYSDHYGVGWIRRWVWNHLRKFHNATIETYVPSQSTIDELRDEGFERLVLWPRGVDATLFRPDRPGRAELRKSLGFRDEDVVIGHVSRIAAEKNVSYLAEALRVAASARSSIRILIVGDGPERPSLEAKLGATAQFVGFRSGDDLADHYAAADIFAFASVTETFGNVILEAMASGLPVVALRAGGPGDIVRSGSTGYLVEPTEPPSVFADSLVQLADDARLRRKIASEAREYAASQTWDRIMIALRQRYDHIVGAASTIRSPADAAKPA